MRFVSQLLKDAIYPAMHHTGWLKSLAPSNGCAVVNYHGVLPSDTSRDAFLDGNLVSQDELQKQLRFLKTNYEAICPEDFRNWVHTGKPLPPRSVLVTCDDGLVNQLLDMLPVFNSEGVGCLFFVTGASCSENPGMLWYEELHEILRWGELCDDDLQILFENNRPQDTAGDLQTLWWNAVLSASRLSISERAERISALRSKCKSSELTLPEKRRRLLNVRELRQLAYAGMTIGAHTMSHPVLSECTDVDSYREIKESRVEIERVVGQTVWAFAYPFGNPATMGAREVNLARETGFECAFVNVGGGVSGRSQPFTISRTHVTAAMRVAELEAHMVGFHTSLQKAIRGWHD